MESSLPLRQSPKKEPRIRPSEVPLGWAPRVLDAVLISIALPLAIVLSPYVWKDRYVTLIACAVALFSLLAEIHGLYRSWRSEPVIREAGRVCMAWFWVLFSILVFIYSTKTSTDYSRQVTLVWFVMVPLAMILWRVALRWGLRMFRAHGHNQKHAVIVGVGESGTGLARFIKEKAQWMGVNVIGFYDEEAPRYNETGQIPAFSGDFEQLLADVRKGRIDQVYIALPMHAMERIRSLIDRLSDTPATVFVVPDLLTSDLLHARLFDFNGLPMISVFEQPHFGLDGYLKRLEDLILASVFLIVTALPMAMIALGIKLTSPGPVIFKQRRYGLDGREIVVWKFRTMTVLEDGGKIPQAKRDDPRLTRFGRFLRNYSLDEFPQFANVLQGRMSVVGPRPHAVAHNEHYRKLIPGYMLRHRVRPGLTGLAQIKGWRGETDKLHKMERRVDHDLEYIRNWSVWLDLKIVILTIFVGFKNTNAY